MKDIVARLRQFEDDAFEPLLTEAATEIEKLRSVTQGLLRGSRKEYNEYLVDKLKLRT